MIKIQDAFNKAYEKKLKELYNSKNNKYVPFNKFLEFRDKNLTTSLIYEYGYIFEEDGYNLWSASGNQPFLVFSHPKNPLKFSIITPNIKKIIIVYVTLTPNATPPKEDYSAWLNIIKFCHKHNLELSFIHQFEDKNTDFKNTKYSVEQRVF